MGSNTESKKVKPRRPTANCPVCGNVTEVLSGKKTKGNLRVHKNVEGNKCFFRSAEDLKDNS